jgi:gamma-glutamylcyclotransferase (GGCT)/AIG2-like uncharacterized protein YtfP
MKYIGAYGSLKKGFYNHPCLEGCPLVGESVIRGTMFLIGGSYPKLFDLGLFDPEYDREHIIEIYEAPEAVYAQITGMERGAGYYEKVIKVDGKEVVVYLGNKEDAERFSSMANYIEAYTHEVLNR